MGHKPGILSELFLNKDLRVDNQQPIRILIAWGCGDADSTNKLASFTSRLLQETAGWGGWRGWGT